MRIFFILVCAVLSFLPAAARAYSGPELEGLVAPVALYPDPVLQDVLAAATAPDQVRQAADWARGNPGMAARDAVRAAQGQGWQPAVANLVAYPELLERMAHSPQWMFDLGNAWLGQQAEVMAAVQALRQRASASGNLQSDQYQTVESTASGIAVAPASPYLYYVPYYDPTLAYGPYWYPAYTPVFWRPWVARPVFVTRVAVRSGPVFARSFVPARPFAAVRPAARHSGAVQVVRPQVRIASQPYHRIPESRRAPIVQSRAAPAVAARSTTFRPSSFHHHPGGRGH